MANYLTNLSLIPFSRNLIRRVGTVTSLEDEFRKDKSIVSVVNRAGEGFFLLLPPVPGASGQKVKFARWGRLIVPTVVTVARERKRDGGTEPSVTETFTRCIYNGVKSIAVRYGEREASSQSTARTPLIVLCHEFSEPLGPRHCSLVNRALLP